MALDLFRLNKGIDIQLDDLSANANILIGSGAPVGTTGDTSTAPIGSVYLRTDSETDGLQLYWKKTSTNAASDWVQGADKAYVDSVAQGLSWREPVRVRDNTVYANAAAFPTGGTIDGVTLSAGDRVLFTNVTLGSDENVFVWTGSAWVEDTNAETDGDAVFVQEGTSADQQYVYTGTEWVLFGSSAGNAELEYLRTFVGKTAAGSELPTYSSTEVVTQSSNLETAIGAVDAAFGTGEITNDGGNYALSDDMAWGTAGTLNVTTALDDLNEGIGNATFTSSGTNITNGASANTSINNLNEALIPLQSQAASFSGTQAAGVTTTMDALTVAAASQVKWLVQTRSTSTPANRRSFEVHAINDGTLVDHTEYASLRLGAVIAGLNINVTVVAGEITSLNSLVGGAYDNDGVYTGVALTGGTGTGATADITVSGGTVTSVVLVNPGSGYTAADSLSAATADLGGTGVGGFSIVAATVSANSMKLTVTSTGGVDYVVKRIAYSTF